MTKAAQRTVLAFDFGTKSIGVAVGQEVTGTAFLIGMWWPRSSSNGNLT